MSEQERQVTTKLRRRNLAASLGRSALWILLALASISIFVLIVWKAPHFLWLLTDAPNMTSVPVSRLPISPSPAGAEHYHVGSVSILLTPEWKNDVRTIKAMGGGLFFKSGQRELFVGLPQSYGKVFVAHRELDASLSSSSPMWLRAAAYKTGKDDFRLSMSWHELNNFCQLLGYKRLACRAGVDGIEELYREDLEGLLMTSKGRATFEWISADGQAAGTLLFSEPSEHIDSGWVRPVCSSFLFSGRTYPEKPSQEMLNDILKDLKNPHSDRSNN